MATRLQLSNIVKSKIDELAPFDGGLTLITAPGNTGNNPIETYIDQFLNESAKETLLEAPFHVLPMTAFTAPAFDIPNKKATITIPTNYLRVGIIKFTPWQRSVFNALYPGDPDYKKQSSRWLRAGAARPAAVWESVAGVGKLICYGVTSNLDYEARYVATTVAESMPVKLHDALTWHCASLVLEVFDKEKQSQMALGRYQKALSLL